MFSCMMLVLLGVSGVIYTHKGRCPELLGFVSTILRDSRYVSMEIGQPLGYMPASELSRLLRGERIRYGHIEMNDTEDFSMGIGLEGGVRRMRKAPTNTSSEATEN